MTFLFPFPSHSHRTIPIPIPTHSHSNCIPIPIRTILIPILVPISSPKLLPFPMGIPWEYNGNGNSHSNAHIPGRRARPSRRYLDGKIVQWAKPKTSRLSSVGLKREIWKRKSSAFAAYEREKSALCRCSFVR